MIVGITLSKDVSSEEIREIVEYLLYGIECENESCCKKKISLMNTDLIENMGNWINMHTLPEELMYC